MRIEWYYLYKIILRNGDDAGEIVEFIEMKWPVARFGRLLGAYFYIGVASSGPS